MYSPQPHHSHYSGHPQSPAMSTRVPGSPVYSYHDPFAVSQPVTRIYVNQIFLRHSRSLLVLACAQLAVAMQAIVFAKRECRLGMICRFYDGCRLYSGIWIGLLLMLNAVLGVILVKIAPKARVLYTYLVTSLLAIVLSFALFIIIACLLEEEESQLRTYFRHETQDYVGGGINRIIENTKIAMYALLLVLAAVHGVCSTISTILCYMNVWCVPEGDESRLTYVVARSPVGEHPMLVPVEVTNAAPEEEMDGYLNCANTATQTSYHGNI